MKNIVAPNAKSMVSAGARDENHAQIKGKKSVGWEMQRRIPASVAHSIQMEKLARAARGFRVD